MVRLERALLPASSSHFRGRVTNRVPPPCLRAFLRTQGGFEFHFPTSLFPINRSPYQRSGPQEFPTFPPVTDLDSCWNRYPACAGKKAARGRPLNTEHE